MSHFGAIRDILRQFRSAVFYDNGGPQNSDTWSSSNRESCPFHKETLWRSSDSFNNLKQIPAGYGWKHSHLLQIAINLDPGIPLFRHPKAFLYLGYPKTVSCWSFNTFQRAQCCIKKTCLHQENMWNIITFKLIVINRILYSLIYII